MRGAWGWPKRSRRPAVGSGGWGDVFRSGQTTSKQMEAKFRAVTHRSLVLEWEGRVMTTAQPSIAEKLCLHDTTLVPDTPQNLSLVTPTESCKAGTYLKDKFTCEQCAPGTHQLLDEQTSCPPCPLGSYSRVGWTFCIGKCSYTSRAHTKIRPANQTSLLA